MTEIRRNVKEGYGVSWDVVWNVLTLYIKLY